MNAGARRLKKTPRFESLESRLPLAAHLAITEINYSPREPGLGSAVTDRNDFEFIELKNAGDAAIQLQNYSLNGIGFTFGPQLLAAGEHLIVVKSLAAYQERYLGVGATVAGQYTGSLNNAGETIELRDGANNVVVSVTYDELWHPASDGVGHTLVLKDPTADTSTWSNVNAWHASSRIDGSPGADDTGLYPGAIVINEVSTHTDFFPEDWIELHNTSDEAVDLNNWFLSDNKNLTKYRITNKIIPAGGYVVFTEANNFGPTAPDQGRLIPFGLSELGEEVKLSSPSGPMGEDYGDFVEFGAANNDVTHGRYTRSDGATEFVLLATSSRGLPNGGPLVGPIVISEIMYHPADEATGAEFIELFNANGGSVPLYDPAVPTNRWKIGGSVDFTFPSSISIPSGGRVLLVTGSATAFRTLHSIPASTPIFSIGAIDSNLLGNASGVIELLRPGNPEPPEAQNPGFVPYYIADRVAYFDADGWPSAADGDGPSLVRRAPLLFGSDRTSWTAGVVGGSPGQGDPDLIGPRVTQVVVDGSGWTMDPFVMPVGTDVQLAPLSWAGVDRITIHFDEPVTIAAGAMAVDGAAGGSYTITPSVVPGVAASEITWTFGAPIGADRLQIDLERELTLDLVGNQLDGDWTDATSVFPSGDGTSGRDFRFQFNVLPGDVDQNGLVDAVDKTLAISSVRTAVGDAGYLKTADLDGNGLINLLDVLGARDFQGSELPDEPAPSPVASGIPPSLVDAAVEDETPRSERMADASRRPARMRIAQIDRPEARTPSARTHDFTGIRRLLAHRRLARLAPRAVDALMGDQ